MQPVWPVPHHLQVPQAPHLDQVQWSMYRAHSWLLPSLLQLVQRPLLAPPSWARLPFLWLFQALAQLRLRQQFLRLQLQQVQVHPPLASLLRRPVPPLPMCFQAALP